MGNTFFFQWEVDLMVFLQAHMNEFAVKLASFVSIFGEELAMVVILGFVYWALDKKKGLQIGINMMFAILSFPMLKNIALRRRPYMDNESIKCLKLIDKEADAMDIVAQGYSFPSGHSTNAAVACGSLARIYKKKALSVIAIVVPLLVGISRFCLGVHYPTDVLVGWTIGYIGVFLVPFLQSKFKNEYVFYWFLFAIASLGVLFCRTNDYYSGLGIFLGLILGTLFEKKFVNFKETKNWLARILRVLGGVVIFFGLNTVLKMPFSDELLASATPAQFAIRFARYAIIIFLLIGIYPMVFGKVVKEK